MAVEEQVAAAAPVEETPAAAPEEEEEIAELDDDMKAAIDGAPAGSPLPDDDDEFGGEQVAEDLKEAVEGSFRMKRMLERDEDDELHAKKAKTETPEATVVTKLLTKWQMTDDKVTKYVLDVCKLDELKNLDATGYMPDKTHWQKSAPDLLARYINECRERKTPGGGSIDVVTSFKFRHKLDMMKEKTLRSLNHKELRYVLNNFDGSKAFDDVVKEAKEYEPDEECTENALPDGAGVSTIGRFCRLELIDPLADAAVFGDANLTFAIKLARHWKALGHVGRVIATTFEDLPTLRERYPEIDETIAELESYFAEVHHEVDCTRIAVDERFKVMQGTLGAVYYNYPHSGAIGGFFDGHPLVNWRHENLMKLFFRALRSFVKPGGSVKVASNMGAVGVRFSYIVNSAIANEFVHVETMQFLEWHLHRYGRSYGDRRDAYKRPDAQNNQSYNAQNADRDMVYCFSYAPTDSPNLTPVADYITHPPSLKTLQACYDGPFKSLTGNSKINLAAQLRKRFVTEASGTHVG